MATEPISIYRAIYTVTYIPIGKTESEQKTVEPGTLFDDMPADAVLNSLHFGAIAPADDGEIARFLGLLNRPVVAPELVVSDNEFVTTEQPVVVKGKATKIGKDGLL